MLKAGFFASSLLVIAGSAFASPTYTWDWQPGDPGSSTNNAGKINWVETTLNAETRELSWTVNVSEHGGQVADGFSLMLTNGFSPLGTSESAAMLYFDASSLGSPVLSAYCFNGVDDASSYRDGSNADGTQDAVRIASTRGSGAERFAGTTDLFATTDGTSRTMGFTMSLDSMMNYGDAAGFADWYGMGYDKDIRAMMTTFSGLDAGYGGDGFLRKWDYDREGMMSSRSKTTGTQPVPEPATLTLLGMGLAGVAVGRRRRRI